jgi:hypothetical protein
MSLSKCSHNSCWKPAPAVVPPIASNATHLPCYMNQQTPKHPNWPTGNLGKVSPRHTFQGWSCFPSKNQATRVVAVHIKIGGQLVLELQANVSRPGLRGKTPCLGEDEEHGFTGMVPEKYLEGKYVMSAYAVNDPEFANGAANLVLLGQDSLCNGVSCGPDEVGHAWHAFEAEQRVWNVEQSIRAML